MVNKNGNGFKIIKQAVLAGSINDLFDSDD